MGGSRGKRPAAGPSGGRAKAAEAAPSCLDPASGLYHLQHFRLSLSYELNRMERTDKPLGLIALRLPKEGPVSMRALGAFLRKALRPLDTPAKIGEREVAALMPEADRDRASSLLRALADKFGDGSGLSASIACGWALARPWEEWTAAKLLAKAKNSMGPASAAIAKMAGPAGPWAQNNSALAAAEKDSLFDGFSLLAAQGQKSPCRSVPKAESAD
jgi:GGDEF domain-containing protein